jgi:DNA polymerase I-like protein with 3'-5' exonuclease and polymerase domains
LTNWINYSTLDAELTFFLYKIFKEKLLNMKINFESMTNLFELYKNYWLKFGETLTDMERTGIYVDRNYFK